MGPKIEYEKPLAVGMPNKVAQGDKIRRESRKRRSGADKKKSERPRSEEGAGEPADAVDSDTPQDLGKRVDFEA